MLQSSFLIWVLKNPAKFVFLILKNPVICFALLLCTPVFAQDISLDPVTVTSSLVEKRASQTGRNIAVIKGEYFQNLPVHSIDDLLRYVPGVEIQARGPMGSQSDIVLRGGTFQQVLIILDGLRLNDPNTGHFNAYIPISPSEIERIEVLKGASSAIYGSDAVGGVIHVISKTFAARLQSGNEDESTMGTLKTSINGALTAGQYGLKNANVGAFVQKDKLAISGGFLSNNASGVQQRGIKGYFHNNTASVSLNYALSPSLNVAVRSAYDHRDFAAQNFYTALKSDTASEKVETSWNQIKIGYKTEKTAITLDGGYKFVRDQYLFNPHSIANNSKSQLWQGLLTWQQTFTQSTNLIAGLNYQNRNIASNDRGDHALSQLAPFVSLVQNIGANFTVTPSVRLDWRESIGSEVVPQVNLSYKKDNWQFRGSAGKTIRDADFTERFNNYKKALVTGGNVGNPALKAEKSFSYEAGADWFLTNSNTNQLKISGTFFQRLQNDLIDYVSTPYAQMPRKENLAPTGTFGLALNIAEVNTTGFEIDFQTVNSFSTDQKLIFNAGLTWLKSESSNLEPSFYVSSHAKFLGNFSAIYQVSGFSVSLNGLYKNRAERAASAIEANISKDYFLLNAKAEYAFLNRSLAVFVQADNAFDVQYSDLLGSKMPGRWAMAGLRFNFVK
ncbi:TonB-dependent receptor [Dyadobacter chenwenxiniae]|uniref:TonB-dependent receptor n=1 Tax=Dyadobacter chenwenxiniae TaxID=2906456 RepID=A0A9X1PRB4_9BACT|nr:TonB-dependent receptor [Dyadobacter chenwenxiniae]MCF0064248.1 TonB-dependent receptor [Dyadobacter chenwenxiniae]UON82539.1 TonB-dependent receptor [Dyadobacter chenwenxiniae]